MLYNHSVIEKENFKEVTESPKLPWPSCSCMLTSDHNCKVLYNSTLIVLYIAPAHSCSYAINQQSYAWQQCYLQNNEDTGQEFHIHIHIKRTLEEKIRQCFSSRFNEPMPTVTSYLWLMWVVKQEELLPYIMLHNPPGLTQREPHVHLSSGLMRSMTIL